MKQNYYKITAQNRFQTVIQFLRKELGWKPTDPLVCPHILSKRDQKRMYLIFMTTHQFTYINMAFSPASDDIVNNLFKVR